LRDVKQSMYIELASSLQRQLGLDTLATHEHVDVVKDGLPFRLHLFVKRELALLRARGAKRAAAAARDTDPEMARLSRIDLADARRLDVCFG
jgi:hypothetical protein